MCMFEFCYIRIQPMGQDCRQHVASKTGAEEVAPTTPANSVEARAPTVEARARKPRHVPVEPGEMQSNARPALQDVELFDSPG